MWHRKMLIAAFFLILLAIPVIAFLPLWESGGRYPANALSPKPEALISGEYMEQLDAFLAERLPFRESMAEARARLALLEGRMEINGVFVGPERLMENLPEPSEEYTRQAVSLLNAFAGSRRNQEVLLMLVPTAAEIYPEDLPPFAQSFDQVRYIQSFYRELPGITCVDAYTPLSTGRSGPVFYRTDHCWTSYGAYQGYSALAKSLGYRAASWDLFNIEHAAHDYQGDLCRRTRLGDGLQDTVDLYTYAYSGVVEDVIRDNGKNTVTYPTIFFREELDSENKCQVFLGSEPGVLYIRTNLDNGKRLLLFKDSLAEPLMQFLPLHYEEITLVDLWSFHGRLEDYLNVFRYQQVLFLLDMTSLSKEVPFSAICMEE